MFHFKGKKETDAGWIAREERNNPIIVVNKNIVNDYVFLNENHILLILTNVFILHEWHFSNKRSRGNGK